MIEPYQYIQTQTTDQFTALRGYLKKAVLPEQPVGKLMSATVRVQSHQMLQGTQNQPSVYVMACTNDKSVTFCRALGYVMACTNDKSVTFCRALGVRQSTEYAPWSVAVSHIVDVYRYLHLMPSKGCADKWASFVRQSIVDPTLGNNTQLALNFTSPETKTALPDIQSRLLRPLLAGLSNEFNDTAARVQAQAIFGVRAVICVLQNNISLYTWLRCQA